MFSLIYAWINDWVNNHEAGDLRRQHGHYDVIVMDSVLTCPQNINRGRFIQITNIPIYSVAAFRPLRSGVSVNTLMKICICSRPPLGKCWICNYRFEDIVRWRWRNRVATTIITVYLDETRITGLLNILIHDHYDKVMSKYSLSHDILILVCCCCSRSVLNLKHVIRHILLDRWIPRAQVQ